MTCKGLILSDAAYDIGNALTFMILGGERLRYSECLPQTTALPNAPVNTAGRTFAEECLS